MNEQTEVPVINPIDPKFNENPHATYDPLRSTDPVYRDTVLNRILVTRAKEVGEILQDRQIPCDPRKTLPDAYARRTFWVDENYKPSLLRMDDPDHKRVRSAVAKVFNQTVVDAMRGRIEEITTVILDTLVGRTSFELIEEFARPLPITVIAEFLGVDDVYLAEFMQWSIAMLQSFNPAPTPQQKADMMRGRDWGIDYFKKVVDARRTTRGNDFISSLITAEEQGQLTEWEILSTCDLLLLAGNVTTTDLIGNGVVALLQHPEQLQKLRANPALLPHAIEEILRYDSPITSVNRVTTDTIRIDGCPFHAGQSISLMLDAANHDPALHEDPHTFDIERTNQRHYSFGGGAHFCLGAPLARAEAEIAFKLLLERFPKLALDPARPPKRKLAPSFHGFESLWVTV
ncbi:cytochrome P450 [Terriglobus saanensis]|uniref:Cytochrome P450 n=1 Tax=Terriglobus saanensis (strain ATCC BAA-1853 / DSM 23119 / SP1PR4) TaxID=401053 RepID=E8V5A1_TERSS|nr:cytochrome P450 [Terriglobus saanensis]ADV84860.1 cytochrome P450 [Terriglobus saanensis SP1PR4]